MKKTSLVLLVAVVFSLVFLGCKENQAFISTITGTIQEEQSNSTTFVPVKNVDVYAFLSESERDRAVAVGVKPLTTVNIFHGISDANGTYTIPLEWGSSSPAFGTSVDRVPIYLAFYHQEFGNGKLVASTAVTYASSMRTNTMETMLLMRSSQMYTLTMDIRNYKNNEAVPASSFRVNVLGQDGTTVLYSGVPTGDTISFAASTSGISGTVSISPNGTDTFRQCDVNGVASSETSAFNFTKNNKLSTSTTIATPLYVKEAKTTYTLNLDLWEVIPGNPPSYQELLPTSFIVTVKEDAGGIVLYTGTPTSSSITFLSDADPSTALKGKVTITPIAGGLYDQSDSTGIIKTESASFSFADNNKNTTTTKAGKLYAVAVKSTFTLTLDLKEVVKDDSNGIIYKPLVPTAFTVKVVNEDNTVLYNATPTTSDITFTSASYTAVNGKVTITPNTGNTYVSCDINGATGTPDLNSTIFSFSKNETASTTSPLYAKSKMVTRTLNLSIMDIADATGNTIIPSTNFNVTVTNGTKVCYSGSPVGNTIPISTDVVDDDQTAYNVTIKPLTLKSYYMCSDDGTTNNENMSTTVIFGKLKTKQVSTYAKNLTIPAVNIFGTFAAADGTTSGHPLNTGRTVKLYYGSDNTGTYILSITTISKPFEESATTTDGYFTCSVPQFSIPISQYTGKQYSHKVFFEVKNSLGTACNTTLEITNNPNDPKEATIMILDK